MVVCLFGHMCDGAIGITLWYIPPPQILTSLLCPSGLAINGDSHSSEEILCMNAHSIFGLQKAFLRWRSRGKGKELEANLEKECEE